jgi:hypothetical protein
MQFAFFRALGLGLGLALCPAFGQNAPAQESSPSLSSLCQLNRSSGYIFDGTVLSVHPVAPSATGVVTMQITFRVEQAIRGTRSGQILTIWEWAAVWNSGERYRPGERLLLFLYSPGKLGLTSTVGGPLGLFSVDATGAVMLADERLSVLSLETLMPQVRHKDRVNARALALAIQNADAE